MAGLAPRSCLAAPRPGCKFAVTCRPPQLGRPATGSSLRNHDVEGAGMHANRQRPLDGARLPVQVQIGAGGRHGRRRERGHGHPMSGPEPAEEERRQARGDAPGGLVFDDDEIQPAVVERGGRRDDAVAALLPRVRERDDEGRGRRRAVIPCDVHRRCPVAEHRLDRPAR